MTFGTNLMHRGIIRDMPGLPENIDRSQGTEGRGARPAMMDRVGRTPCRTPPPTHATIGFDELYAAFTALPSISASISASL